MVGRELHGGGSGGELYFGGWWWRLLFDRHSDSLHPRLEIGAQMEKGTS